MEKPIDEAAKCVTQLMEKRGFKKWRRLVAVKDQENWIGFVEFSPVKRAKPWVSRLGADGFQCEFGIFFKGAPHPYGPALAKGYGGENASSVIDCHFRRTIIPPLLYANFRTRNFWSGVFWDVSRTGVFKSLEHRIVKEVDPWLARFENLEAVRTYISEIDTHGPSHALRAENLNKWGLVSGAADLKALLAA